ncbi:extracellular solute-binding protein [Lentimicrobium sp. L6]|uniref:extracellular solute-binding protein n=1 Tax=Lentimicrobium sp. L6 TaxID=2735916 RepID=UPI001555C348|nr:PotD/PotF family extracellular solute-binding protein [Lentimicrobium sp. L6]NPD85149.1 extracellular solute-binding protein [Lentimicrobium sp. L6]
MKLKLRQLSIFLVLIFLITSCSSKKEKSVKFISWGGKFQKDLVENWVKPISDTLNISLTSESWNGDYGILTSRITKGINTWDIIHVEDHYINHPSAENIFEKFNTENKCKFKDELFNEYGIPLLQYGYILAYDTRNNEVENPTWNDFFNIQSFSGKRGLRDFPIGNIEIALLALGRGLDSCLYNPLLTKNEIEHQLDDAFDLLNSINSETIWWTTGDQLQKGLESGEFAMVASWSGRIWSINKSAKNKSTIKINPKDALISTDWLIIPKGAKNIEEAKQLLFNLYKYPQNAKNFSLAQGYLVPSEDISINNSDSEIYLKHGSFKNKKGIIINNRFWSKNFSWISQEWNSWRLKK